MRAMNQTGYLRRAGCDGIDGYAVRPQLHCHRLSEANDPCFGCTVGGTPRATELASHRCNVDDTSAARIRHRSGRRLAADERPRQVDVEHGAPSIEAYSRNGARLTMPA